MSSSYFIKVMSAFAVISGVVFTLMFFLTNPDQGVGAKSLFLFSLFVFIFSVFSLFSFLLKRKVSNNEVSFASMKSSFRQGMLIGLFTVIALLLSAIGLLTWWDLSLLAFSLLLIELYFNSNKVGDLQK